MSEIMKEFKQDRERGQLLRGLQIVNKKFDNLNVLETGTIRTYTETSRSTIKIAEFLRIHGGHLTTIDYVDKNIEVSKDVCSDYDNITFVVSDSIKYIKEYDKQIHLGYLDSANSSEHIYKEFIAILPLMVNGGVIVIDDYRRGVKCDKVIEELKEKNYEYDTYRYQLLVKVTEELKEMFAEE